MNRPHGALRTPAECPVCGEAVPRGALACPECGADHNSGWKEDAETYDALDLPDADFDYDQFAAEEFGGLAKPGGLNRFWWITGIFVIAALVLIYFCALR